MPTIEEEQEALRGEIAALGDNKYLRRYPEHLRARIVAHVKLRLPRGESVAGVARSIGVSEVTLAKFMKAVPEGRRRGRRQARKRTSRRPSGRGSIVPVVVRTAEGDRVLSQQDAPTRIRVRASGGLVIEGLSIDELATLIGKVASCSV